MSGFTELIRAVTKSEALDQFVSFLRLGGFPVASWQSLSLPRQFTEALSESLSDVHEAVAAIAKSGINRYAFGLWLDILSEGFYGNKRKPAVATRGYVTFTDAASVGPVARAAANPVWFELGGRRYKTIADFTVPLNGSATKVLAEAESAGVLWNVPLNTTGALVTSIPGVTVSNPDPGDNNGTWIVQQGSNTESDLELQERNELKWAALNVAATDATYEYWCRTLAPSVSRVQVVEDKNSSRVDLYLAGPAGSLIYTLNGNPFSVVSEAESLALMDYISAKVRPLGNAVTFNYPLNLVVPIAGTYYVATGTTLEQARADVTAALVTLFGSQRLGGSTIYRSQIIAAIQNVSGISHVNLTAPAADVTPAVLEVAVPDVAGLVGTR